MSESRVSYERDESTLEFPEIGADVRCKVAEHVIGKLDSLPAAAGTKHRQPCRVVRPCEFDGKPPFESGEKSLLEILELNRRTVGSKHELLSTLVEMVEYVEEGILRTVAGKILNVIDDENVHLHVEGHEISELIVHISLHILRFEPVGRYIENYEFRELLLNCDTDCLSEVRLSEPRTSEEEKRVERRFSRRHRNALPCCHAHLVAFAFDEVVKTIDRIQLRIHLNSLKSRIYKRSRCAGSVHRRNRNRSVDGSVTLRCRAFHRRLDPYRLEDILKLSHRTDLLLERRLQKIEVVVLKPLHKECRWHFNRELGPSERHRTNRTEPYIKLLRLYILFYKAQAVVPNLYVSFLCHSLR